MWTFHDDLQAIHTGEDPSGNRPALMRIMAHATLFEIRNDPAATYIAQAPLSRPIPKGKVIYHTNHPPSYIEKGYHLHIPKAPTTLLEETLEIFRAVPDIEAHVNIVHRTADASYRLISTQAEASRGHVVTSLSPTLQKSSSWPRSTPTTRCPRTSVPRITPRRSARDSTASSVVYTSTGPKRRSASLAAASSYR